MEDGRVEKVFQPLRLQLSSSLEPITYQMPTMNFFLQVHDLPKHVK